MHTARMLKPGTSTYAVGYHYLTEHDDDPWPKRRVNDFSDNFNASSVATGANFLWRRGLVQGVDLGLNTSFGTTSVEPRLALWNGERFASAIGTKLVFPTFSLDVPTLYRYKIAWYHSVELLPSFAVYAVPHFEWKPLGREKQIVGFTAGLLVGKDSGVIAEATYAHDLRGEDPKTYEQFIIGYATGLENLEGRLRSDTWSRFIKVLPSIGSSVFPVPSVGLSGRYLTGGSLDYELGIDLGVGPIPEQNETKVGFVSSRVYSLRARTSLDERNFFLFGLARKEMRANLELAEGWWHLKAVNHGIDLGWEQVYDDWQITWLGVYIPLLFLPHNQVLKAPEIGFGVASEAVQAIADRYEQRISFSLLKVRKEF